MNKQIQTIRTYYELLKPGMVYANVFAAVAGFLLASKGHIHLSLLIAVIIGVSCVIGSACAFNNYIDRNIDKKMERTKERSLAIGKVPPRNALLYATIIGCIGFVILLQYTNLLTVILGVMGYIDYIILYGISKRHSVYGTIVGSISGAIPPVAGYTAVTNRFDMGALLLFLILTFWQMPHFYSIAIFRLKDYKAARLPVWPVKKGIQSTRIQMLLYIVAFTIAGILLSLLGYANHVYIAVIILLGIIWLVFGIQGFHSKQEERWARKMFFLSLIVLLVVCIMLSVNSVIPI